VCVLSNEIFETYFTKNNSNILPENIIFNNEGFINEIIEIPNNEVFYEIINSSS
jgi:hypothetical protein